MRFWFFVALLIGLVFYSPEISKFLDLFFNHPLRHAVSVLIGMIFFIGCSSRSNSFVSKLSFYAFVLGVLGFLVIWASAYFFDKTNMEELKFLLIFGLGGFIGLLLLDRIFSPLSEKLRKAVTQKAGTQREVKTDIRDIQNSFKSVLKYDPQKFFHPEKWFFGLDHQGTPIYFNAKKLLHTQITGASGFGKSVLLGILAFQSILKREATIVFDPKQGGDEWFPSVCYKASQAVNVPYLFLNIRADVPQLNLLAGMTVDQMINLLIVGLSLEDQGDTADHYRRKDRAMVRFIAKNYQEGMTLKEISQTYDEYFRKNEAEGLADGLQELAEVESVNAHDGISLKEVMDQGHVLYIAGDWQDPKHITVQRMLLARIVQIASDRDNTLDTPKQVCVVLDELSFQISKIFGDALKIIRDKGLHFILAHQSIKDLKNVPKNMDAEAFSGSVLANCSLKFVYRAVDNETAQYFSDFTGKILVDDEARNVEQTLSLTDRVLPEKQIRQTERNLIDFNTMLSLPQNTGVLFGNGIAQISAIYPIEVEKNLESKTVKGFEQPKTSQTLDESSPLIFETLG